MGKKTDEELTIDLLQVFRLLWKYIVLILIVAMIGAVLLFFYARMFVTPKYEANALFYVNNSTFSLSSAVRISTGELNAAADLVDTYVAIMQSRANMEQVIEESGVNYTYEQLRQMVSAKAVNSTGLFQVTVRSTNPEEARNLANVIATILPAKISDIVSNSSVVVVDSAVTPHARVSPSYTKYAAIGFLLGAVLCSAVILIISFFDDVIHDEDYILQNFNEPLLASIPDLTARGSGKYGKYGYYGASEKAKKGGVT